MPVARHRLELPDGDFLDLDIAAPARPAMGSPWALVLHGLEGSSRSGYVVGLARRLVELGVETCLVSYRGCSGEPNRLGRSYHSGETEDVRAALRWLAATRAGRPWGLAGFSIGANLTMKLLGEGGALPPGLVQAVAVSPPFDLAGAATHLDRPGAIVYRGYLLRTLRRKALDKIARFPGIASARDVARATSLRAFDDAFTAPVHGFDGARDYWTRCSGARFVPSIEHPLLVVAAEDDPFFPRGYVRSDLVAANPRIELALASRGGHVGFVSGSPLAPAWWGEERAAGALARAFAAALVTERR